MGIKQLVKRVMPGFIKSKARAVMQSKGLKSVSRLEFITDHLRAVDDLDLNEIFNASDNENLWKDAAKEIEIFNIPDATGGVNPGDRRALFYLIAALKPLRVLEVGTHIGASTIHIASALHHGQKQGKGDFKFTTLDIRDVNSTETKPWLEFGTKLSPIEMIKKLNYSPFVTFLTGKSLEYLQRNDQKFDFIFLDGDHAAKTVYQEVAAALKCLHPNGVILLHDFFPDLKPLWSNGVVLRGPYMAVERMLGEGAELEVVPLGSVPWFTKLN